MITFIGLCFGASSFSTWGQRAFSDVYSQLFHLWLSSLLWSKTWQAAYRLRGLSGSQCEGYSPLWLEAWLWVWEVPLQQASIAEAIICLYLGEMGSRERTKVVIGWLSFSFHMQSRTTFQRLVTATHKTHDSPSFNLLWKQHTKFL